MPNDVKDLILSLLVLDPQKRLGANRDFKGLKAHSFFKGINFEKLPNSEAPIKHISNRNGSSVSLPEFIFSYQTLSDSDTTSESYSQRVSEIAPVKLNSMYFPNNISTFVILEGNLRFT